VRIVNQLPSSEDVTFIDHRSHFLLQDLIEFNELREVRKLRKAIMENEMREVKTLDIMTKLDLVPEMKALDQCLKKLHKKLKIN
jgi:hypothetical protein